MWMFTRRAWISFSCFGFFVARLLLQRHPCPCATASKNPSADVRKREEAEAGCDREDAADQARDGAHSRRGSRSAADQPVKGEWPNVCALCGDWSWHPQDGAGSRPRSESARLGGFDFPCSTLVQARGTPRSGRPGAEAAGLPGSIPEELAERHRGQPRRGVCARKPVQMGSPAG